MKTSSEGFQQCYNAQVAVDGEHQLVVATDLTANASDQGGLPALLDEVAETFGEQPETVLADAGYRDSPRPPARLVRDVLVRRVFGSGQTFDLDVSGGVGRARQGVRDGDRPETRLCRETADQFLLDAGALLDHHRSAPRIAGRSRRRVDLRKPEGRMQVARRGNAESIRFGERGGGRGADGEEPERDRDFADDQDAVPPPELDPGPARARPLNRGLCASAGSLERGDQPESRTASAVRTQAALLVRGRSGSRTGRSRTGSRRGLTDGRAA